MKNHDYRFFCVCGSHRASLSLSLSRSLSLDILNELKKVVTEKGKRSSHFCFQIFVDHREGRKEDPWEKEMMVKRVI